MPIQNAINLIQDIDTDSSLRTQMYEFKNENEVKDFLDSKGYFFTTHEFNDAVNSLHVQCQTLESAQDLLHKAELLKFLLLIS